MMRSIRINKLLWTLIAFTELPLRTFQQTEPTLRSYVGSCPSLTDGANVFGSTTTFSREGLFPSLFIGSDGSHAEDLRIVRSKLLCEAIGAEKNTASSISLLVEYVLHSDQSNNRIAQVVVDCAPNPHGSSDYSFYPDPAPGATGAALKTAQSINGVTLVSNEAQISASFSTEPEFLCGQCEAVTSVFNNRMTRCTGKLIQIYNVIGDVHTCYC